MWLFFYTFLFLFYKTIWIHFQHEKTNSKTIEKQIKNQQILGNEVLENTLCIERKQR